MPVATLEKSPTVKRLIRQIRAIAPHLQVEVRDKKRYTEYKREVMRKRGAPWLRITRDETGNGKPLSDTNPMNATGKSVRPAKESPSRDMSGREIPVQVASGMAAGLSDKPRGK